MNTLDTSSGSVMKDRMTVRIIHKNNDTNSVVFFLSSRVYFSLSIPNLQDKDQAPSISVCGRSLLPHCHFDMVDSDYISGNRRNPEFRGLLDPNTRVIEFNTAGLSVVSTR